jgi:hypothetical protein
MRMGDIKKWKGWIKTGKNLGKLKLILAGIPGPGRLALGAMFVAEAALFAYVLSILDEVIVEAAQEEKTPAQVIQNTLPELMAKLKAQGFIVTQDNSVFKEAPASLLKLKADMVSGFIGADGKPDEAAWKRANPEYWAQWQNRYKAATAIAPVPDASTNSNGDCNLMNR